MTGTAETAEELNAVLDFAEQSGRFRNRDAEINGDTTPIFYITRTDIVATREPPVEWRVACISREGRGQGKRYPNPNPIQAAQNRHPRTAHSGKMSAP